MICHIRRALKFQLQVNSRHGHWHSMTVKCRSSKAAFGFSIGRAVFCLLSEWSRYKAQAGEKMLTLYRSSAAKKIRLRELTRVDGWPATQISQSLDNAIVSVVKYWHPCCHAAYRWRWNVIKVHTLGHAQRGTHRCPDKCPPGLRPFRSP